MTDFASTDVTVTVLKRGLIGKDKIRRCTVTFGNAALTIPANGVPLPVAGVFGLSRVFDIWFSSDTAGYVYKYDSTYHSIKIYQGTTDFTAVGTALTAHTHDLKYIGSITATELVAVASADTLGKNAATNRTIAGADSDTKGGVVAVTGGTPGTGITHVAAPMSHATAAAPAAATLVAYAIGR